MREHLRTKRRLAYLDTEACVLPLAAREVVSRHEFYQYLTAARDLRDTMEASDDPLPNIEVFYPMKSPKRHRSGEAANTHAEIENNLRKVSKPVAALKGDSSPTHNVEESSSVEQEVALASRGEERVGGGRCSSATPSPGMHNVGGGLCSATPSSGILW